MTAGAPDADPEQGSAGEFGPVARIAKPSHEFPMGRELEEGTGEVQKALVARHEIARQRAQAGIAFAGVSQVIGRIGNFQPTSQMSCQLIDKLPGAQEIRDGAWHAVGLWQIKEGIDLVRGGGGRRDRDRAVEEVDAH